MPKGPKARGVIERHVEGRVSEALDDTRIVALVGPRQSGKTTLARKLSAARDMTFITLDDDQYRQFANDDPAGFIRNLDRAVIDEIQRAPGLFLALKKTVDENPRRRQQDVLLRKAMTRQTANKMIKRRALYADLPGEISNHSFRGTGITEYLRNGGDLETAARIAGHESTRTTQPYNRPYK